MSKPVYVSQLSISEQREISNKIRLKLIKDGYTEIEIHSAIKDAMDSKISDILHVLNE